MQPRTEVDPSFCQYSQDTDTGGHSPEWTDGDRCRWCGVVRDVREPDIVVTPDLARNPWTNMRGGSFRQGDVRRVGLYRHEERGRLVAIAVQLTDGSDAIAYASLSSVVSALAILRRTAIYREEQRAQTTTIDVSWLQIGTALVVITALVTALIVTLT
jgi:hypothetical protein